MSRLFGTDGIRGVANEDLKPTLAHALGRAVATRAAGGAGRILVGQDTRRSGDMLVAALVSRCAPRRAPTSTAWASARRRRSRSSPAAWATPRASWSRLPTTRPTTTGSRCSTAQGLKLDDAVGGRARDAHLALRRAAPAPRNDGIGRSHRRSRGHSIATWSTAWAWPAASAPTCASRSTAPTVRRRPWRPRSWRPRAPRVSVHFDDPDGSNINLDCGATAPAALAPSWPPGVVGRRLQPRWRRRPLRRRR